jgi:hypothetical protein
VVLIELEERRIMSNSGHKSKFSWRILIGSHSSSLPLWSPYPVHQLVSEQIWSLVGSAAMVSAKVQQLQDQLETERLAKDELQEEVEKINCDISGDH